MTSTAARPAAAQPPSDDGSGERQLLLTAGAVLALVGWLLAVPWLVFAAGIAASSLFGVPPEEAELREAAALLRWAAGAAVGLPVLAAVLLRGAAHRGAARLATGCAVVGLVAAGWLLVAAEDTAPGPEAAPPAPPATCIERSGPPSTCPGG